MGATGGGLAAERVGVEGLPSPNRALMASVGVVRKEFKQKGDLSRPKCAQKGSESGEPRGLPRTC